MITQTTFILDPNHAEVKRDIVDCHGLHKRTMRMFHHVNDSRDNNEVLFRLDTNDSVLSLTVQAQQYPDVTSLPLGYAKPPITSHDVEPHIDGYVCRAVLPFVLIANPTKKSIHTHQRVDLADPAEIIAWLDRRLIASGCQLHLAGLKAPKLPQIVGVHPMGKLSFTVYRFSGMLTILDPLLLKAALVAGIGPGKAYGSGLLTLG